MPFKLTNFSCSKTTHGDASMKKTLFVLVAIFAAICSFAFAEDQPGPQTDAQQPDDQQSVRPGEKQGMMMSGGMGMMPGGAMGKMGGPMAGAHPSVVATNDGGVIVLMGSKLAKYDNNLNLVKEVELKPGPKPADQNADAMVMNKPWAPPQNQVVVPAEPPAPAYDTGTAQVPLTSAPAVEAPAVPSAPSAPAPAGSDTPDR